MLATEQLPSFQAHYVSLPVTLPSQVGESVRVPDFDFDRGPGSSASGSATFHDFETESGMVVADYTCTAALASTLGAVTVTRVAADSFDLGRGRAERWIGHRIRGAAWLYAQLAGGPRLHRPDLRAEADNREEFRSWSPDKLEERAGMLKQKARAVATEYVQVERQIESLPPDERQHTPGPPVSVGTGSGVTQQEPTDELPLVGDADRTLAIGVDGPGEDTSPAERRRSWLRRLFRRQ